MRTKVRKLAWLPLLTAALLLLAGCPTGTSIANLQRNPGRYQNKEVAVHGTVTQSFGLLGMGAYEINDGTGTIWVLSNNLGMANKGAKVTAIGNFVSGVSLGTRSFALAIRQTHRPHF